MEDKLQVLGALIQGYVSASIGLNIVTGEKVEELTKDIDPNEWYPLEKWNGLQEIVLTAYEDPAPIMQKIGEEMMTNWYNLGPGKGLVKGGAEFLEFQTGSEGYYSVMKGTSDQIGDFKLSEIDKEKGAAKVHSTTPFNRDMERGVLIGGMKAPGDLDFVNVENDQDADVFVVEFH